MDYKGHPAAGEGTLEIALIGSARSGFLLLGDQCTTSYLVMHCKVKLEI